MGIYLSGAGILGCVFWPGAGITCSQGIPPYLYPPYVNVGCLFHHHHQHHTASPSLSAHLCDSAPPTHVGECGFFKSLLVGLPYSSIFWQFWMLFWDLVVILSMVAQGGQAHLPMPSSWSEVSDPAFCSLDRSWTLEFRSHMANLIFDFNFS